LHPYWSPTSDRCRDDMPSSYQLVQLRASQAGHFACIVNRACEPLGEWLVLGSEAFGADRLACCPPVFSPRLYLTWPSYSHKARQELIVRRATSMRTYKRSRATPHVSGAEAANVGSRFRKHYLPLSRLKQGFDCPRDQMPSFQMNKLSRPQDLGFRHQRLA
jgi:hypothetical protein